jgi:hypothetical protein
MRKRRNKEERKENHGAGLQMNRIDERREEEKLS